MSQMPNINFILDEKNTVFKIPVYIVGAGSFAIKLASVLINNKIDFEFIDEYASSPLLERSVYKADAVPKINGLYFIAISIDEYATAAITRLTRKGILESQCIKLKHDSDSIMLGHMFEEDNHKIISILSSPLTDFSKIESVFYNKRSDFFESMDFVKNDLIGICCLGRGGGYLGHLGNIPNILAEKYNTVILSDSIINCNNYSSESFLMGQSAMCNESSLDLVITAHVFTCSPKSTKKLSFSHMVYDFLIFNEQTIEHIQQAQTHYIFVPSISSMKMHQNICLEKKLDNNIILIPGGYPKHDHNIIKYQQYCDEPSDIDSILYAPTLSSLQAGNETDACFSILQAHLFIPEILARFPDKKLIFRPHPEDLALIKFDLNHPRAIAFSKLVSWCTLHPRCEIDSSQNNYLQSFSRSELIISDTSSVAFSFALLTGRPVLLFSNDHTSLIDDYINCQFIADRPKFSQLIDNEEDLYKAINDIFSGDWLNTSSAKFCKSTIYNLGYSEKYLYENFNYILNDQRHPDWWYLKDHIGIEQI